MSDPIRIGIVGLGRMGRRRLSTIMAHPDTVAVVGCDANIRRHDVEGLEVVGDHHAVLEADVDAVFVCTPNRFAPEVVVDALDSGRHVFSEKPPGRTVEDVTTMMTAEARNPGLALKFGFNHRYHLGIVEAKDIIDSQQYGPVLWARGVYGKGERPPGTTEWRSDPHVAGGGILLDQGIHMLDLLRYFVGDFVELKSMCTTAFWDTVLEDNAFALLRTNSGRVASLHSSFTQWKHLFRLEVGFADGFLSVDGMPSSTRSYRDERITHGRRRTGRGFTVGNPPEETRFFNVDPSWDSELVEFVDCVKRGHPVVHGSSHDAYEAMRMVHEIYESDTAFADQLSLFRTTPADSTP
jgi:predicted dehydrogenase